MSAVADPVANDSSVKLPGFDTQVSGYDKVSAVLVAGVLLVGFFAALLFIIWLTKIVIFRPSMPEVVIFDLKGRGEAAEGVARDMEEPGVEELPDVQQPQLADALEAMTDAISTTRGVTEAFEGNAEQMGSGKGKGDSRAAGPGGDGNLDLIPPWERWEVKYSTRSVEDYAQQLDFFDIEIGALHRTSTEINYLSKMASSKRKRRGSRPQEDRLYFVHGKSGALTALTEQLLKGSGIDTNNRLLAQFYPHETYTLLLNLEKSRLGGRSLGQVRKTVFAVEQVGSNYRFTVEQQLFLGG